VVRWSRIASLAIGRWVQDSLEYSAIVHHKDFYRKVEPVMLSSDPALNLNHKINKRVLIILIHDISLPFVGHPSTES